MREYSYDKLDIGQEERFSHRITHEEVLSFSDITQDKNPLHLNDEYAKTTKFGKRVVFGMLVASYMSTIAGMYLPGKYSLILSSETSFPNPCFEGDVLNIRGKIEKKIDAGKIIIIDVLMENQDRKIVCKGKMYVQVLK